MHPTNEAERVLWPVDLAKRYGLNRTTIWRWQQAGHLPPCDVHIGPREGWYERTIVNHERERKAA